VKGELLILSFKEPFRTFLYTEGVKYHSPGRRSLALGCWNYAFGVKDQISEPDQAQRVSNYRIATNPMVNSQTDH
jgi:hypothetical protein